MAIIFILRLVALLSICTFTLSIVNFPKAVQLIFL